MAKLVRLCRADELPPEGEAREFTLEDRQLCVASIDGEVSAMENVCPHRGGPLGQGVIENGKVVCPWHAWAFDAKTGCALHNPEVRVQTYAVRREGEEIFVETPE
jgi:nitrite reductase (NADH) small subunit